MFWLKTIIHKDRRNLDFLNSSIPKLVDPIYYYCKLAEEECLKKTH